MCRKTRIVDKKKRKDLCCLLMEFIINPKKGGKGKGCVGGDGVCQGGESGKMNGGGKMREAEGEKDEGKGGREGREEGESVNRRGAGFSKQQKL
jgi:hypothetical protein